MTTTETTKRSIFLFSVYQVKSINYQVPSDTMVIGTFSTLEKAIDFCEQDLKRVSATNIVRVDDMCFDYISHYGNYRCAKQIVEVFVQ